MIPANASVKLDNDPGSIRGLARLEPEDPHLLSEFLKLG